VARYLVNKHLLTSTGLNIDSCGVHQSSN